MLCQKVDKYYTFGVLRRRNEHASVLAIIIFLLDYSLICLTLFLNIVLLDHGSVHFILKV